MNLSNNKNNKKKPEESKKSKAKFTGIGDLSKLKENAILLINFAVIVAIIFLVIIPQYNSIQTARELIEKKTIKYGKAEAHADYLQGLSDLKDQLASNIDLVKEAIPVEAEVPYYSNQLIQIADKSNVEIKSLSFAGIVESESVGSPNFVKANISVTGDFESVLNFLKNLENSRRLITVENVRVNINYDDDNLTGKEGFYDIQTTVTSYYMPEIKTEDLSMEVLASKPRLENVISKINGMDHYDQLDIDIEIGTLDPFDDEGLDNKSVVIIGDEKDLDTTTEGSDATVTPSLAE